MTMEQNSSFIEMPSFGDDLLSTAMQSITSDVPAFQPQQFQQEIPPLYSYQEITDKGEQLKLFGYLLQELRTLNHRLENLDQAIQTKKSVFNPEITNVPLQFTVQPLQIPIVFSGDHKPILCNIKPESYYRNHHHHHHHQRSRSTSREKRSRSTSREKLKDTRSTSQSSVEPEFGAKQPPQFKTPTKPPPKKADKSRRKRETKQEYGIGSHSKKMKL